MYCRCSLNRGYELFKIGGLSMIDRRPKWEKNLLSDKYYCHFNEAEIDIKECETCGARDCCENNLEKLED